MDDPWIYIEDKSMKAWLLLEELWMWYEKYNRGSHSAEQFFEIEPAGCLKTPLKWVKANGDPRLDEGWVMWKEYNNFVVAKELRDGIHPDEVFKAAIAAGNKKAMLGKPPWRGRAVQPKHRALWCMLSEVFDWRDNAPMKRDKYGKPFGHGYKSACYHFDIKPCTTMQNMIRWIVANGDPRDDDDWLDFHNEYYEETMQFRCLL